LSVVLCGASPPPHVSTLFPTRRSSDLHRRGKAGRRRAPSPAPPAGRTRSGGDPAAGVPGCPGRERAVLYAGGGGAGPRSAPGPRSEEHTSELQSRENLVCRLRLEKKKR